METNVTSAMPQIVTTPAPAPAQPDGRAVADAAASRSNPRPEIALPVPADASQSGLVTRAVLSDKEASNQLGESELTPAERTLKPYGVTMLPKNVNAEDLTAEAPDDAETAADDAKPADAKTADTGTVRDEAASTEAGAEAPDDVVSLVRELSEPVPTTDSSAPDPEDDA